MSGQDVAASGPDGCERIGANSPSSSTSPEGPLPEALYPATSVSRCRQRATSSALLRERAAHPGMTLKSL
jgi:hypothetical protein